jgi:hypothetical protein
LKIDGKKKKKEKESVYVDLWIVGSSETLWNGKHGIKRASFFHRFQSLSFISLSLYFCFSPKDPTFIHTKKKKEKRSPFIRHKNNKKKKKKKTIGKEK